MKKIYLVPFNSRLIHRLVIIKSCNSSLPFRKVKSHLIEEKMKIKSIQTIMKKYNEKILILTTLAASHFYVFLLLSFSETSFLLTDTKNPQLKSNKDNQKITR